MDKIKRNLLILFTPIIIVVCTNELTRPTIKENNFRKNGYNTMNSGQEIKYKCTWKCHNSDTYCIANHVKMPNSLLKYTNPIYMGYIKYLRETPGSYESSNIITLVILIPLFIYILITKCIDNYIIIKKLNNKS
jgi:hypothetical protein